MERALEESEVFEVVKALNGDKTTSPDYFALVFFWSCWGIPKEDPMNVFHDFHGWGTFERSLNALFVAFILKKAGALGKWRL